MTANQLPLTSFETARRRPTGRTRSLQALVRALGTALAVEPRPAVRGSSWRDDEEILQGYVTRDPIDFELTGGDEDD